MLARAYDRRIGQHQQPGLAGRGRAEACAAREDAKAGGSSDAYVKVLDNRTQRRIRGLLIAERSAADPIENL
jgi:hypothetical protein